MGKRRCCLALRDKQAVPSQPNIANSATQQPMATATHLTAIGYHHSLALDIHIHAHVIVSRLLENQLRPRSTRAGTYSQLSLA